MFMYTAYMLCVLTKTECKCKSCPSVVLKTALIHLSLLNLMKSFSYNFSSLEPKVDIGGWEYVQNDIDFISFKAGS